jgi:hypothetical protein
VSGLADPQGLITWWDLADAAAGQPVLGWGPYANHGAIVGGLSFGGSSGVAFDGNSGYVSVPHHGSLEQLTTPVATIDQWAVWVRISRGPTGAIRSIISKGGGSYCLRLDATGRPQILDNGVVTATATAIIDANPHSILAGRNGNSTYIYVDGAFQASGVASGGTPSSGLPLLLGAHTSSAGTVGDYYNGTLHAAAYLPNAMGGSGIGPVILQKLPPGFTLDVPALLTSWRDPADVSNVTARLDYLAGHGREPLNTTNAQWAVTNTGATPSSGALAFDAGGRGFITFPIAAARNGALIDSMALTVRGTGTTSTAPQFYVRAQWAIARLAPNVALGDHVTELTTVPSHSVPATHTAATFLRAATGPNPGDYAAGSSWSLLPSTAQAGLPATNAFLATQLQLVRRA